jgi:hypothetical protein
MDDATAARSMLPGVVASISHALPVDTRSFVALMVSMFLLSRDGG